MPAPWVTLRLDAETKADLDFLGAHYNLSRSAAVRLAIRQLRRAAEREDLPPPDAAAIAAQRRPPGGQRGPRPSRVAQRDQADATPAEEP